jgi:hypothetical protein
MSELLRERIIASHTEAQAKIPIMELQYLFDAPDLTDGEWERCLEMKQYRRDGIEQYESDLHGFLDSLKADRFIWGPGGSQKKLSILDRIQSLTKRP